MPQLRTAAAALALTCGIAACSAGETATQTSQYSADTPGTVVIGLSTAPASLDFTTTAGAAIPQALMDNVYEGLVRISQTGRIEAALAQRWEISDDGKTYTFHLRQGVTFSNGEPFDANTAKFSIDRVRSDAWSNGLKSKMDVVDSTRVIDSNTLEVTLKHRSNDWLWNMGTLVGAMMHPAGVDKLESQPIGTGPYEVERWAVGESLALKARADYWGEPAANERAVLRYFGDATALSNAVRTHDVNAVVGLQSPELLDAIRADESLSVEVGTTNGEVLLSMNNQRAPFDDVRVRQAVMYGVDRQAIIDTTWEGYGVDTGGVPAAPTDPWYYESQRFPYDRQRALALMKEANAIGTSITISVPSLPYAQTASELLYSQLSEIGFDVHIESVEFPAVWLSKVYQGKDYDLSLVAHVEARDIPTMFGTAEYYLGFNDAEVQRLLNQADTAAEDDYIPTMQQAIERIVDQAGADTLYNLPSIIVTKDVSGLPVNAVGDGLELAQVRKEDR
ncbi:ABC transporter substrate-binding protein [Corynebacterium pseudopelargi]|uniref:Glutathione-binding protein GsiB n=1 Tax=Corynebacterium pseudopelargi TaxID=2080757 RepID=A0A3G6ISY5_9CORY|nr:ABC transporter substrate-binding protein [Corynebacterium pseudopelargi]AZA08775.1 Glutathione-binding protein GsiB precursor [Corynebacterium pseudopelargi]